MRKLCILLMLLVIFAAFPWRAHAQGAVEYGAATSAAGSLGAKLGSALGSALNNASNQTSQAVIKEAPTASSRKPNTGSTKAPTKLRATGPASVKIESTPAGAAIFLDSAPQGHSPATLLLAKGLHSLQITQEGFTPWQKTFLVSEGETLTLKPVLIDPKKSTPRFTVQR